MAPPTGFIDLQSVPGLWFDIAYASEANVTGRPLPGYGRPGAWLREAAGRALADVTAALADEGLGLLIYDAYRPVRATDALVAWAEDTGQGWLIDDGYIARRSLHNLGVAVDLTLCDRATGTPLAMGTAFDAFHPSSHALYFADRTDAQGAAWHRERMRLRASMARHGFSPYDTEWWHFTHDASGRPERVDIPYDSEDS
ncbi:MAG: D-alanyl-D-alanine dipeptidase [Pseudomonadota bacterium]|jgi:D-alanyl-D-alanine dipeptidase